MEKVWRWFGTKDRITLDMLRQIGVEGVVTALHDIPNGEVWTLQRIQQMKHQIAEYGLHWAVVESLPVSESIKFGGSDREVLLENYCLSLENLGKCGIKTVCYNFMPVIDWIRTDLNHQLPDGTQTLFFDKIRFAYFDCCILERKDARADYTSEQLAQLDQLALTITPTQREALIDTIIVKTQGFINGNIKQGDMNPVAIFKSLLAQYENIDRTQLRQNMKYFLERVIPVARKYNINMCVHPDDPPYQVLGLPRIVTCMQDIDWILEAVDDTHNGLTFCAGSLSSGLHNNVAELARRYVSRTHFVHLRSTDATQDGNFIEASHLGGRGQLVELVRIFEKEKPALPMRVDHGKLMLDDHNKGDNPGYSFLGRMVALAQVSGMMAVVNDELKNKQEL